MDHESLRTASTYLNNLLLARGLLRNSEPVDFVKPSREARAQIINLVHDLILREDQSAAQREQFAHTLRNLRNADTQHTKTIERLTSQCEDSARTVAAAQAAERAAQAEVKRVERALKTLQDQATKLKVALQQVRSQCATDVRKKDLELARLKTHLQGQQRGNRSAAVAPSLVLAKKPGSGAAEQIRKRGNNGNTTNTSAGSQRPLGDAEYNLRQETTEFLTQLSQSLSDENDNLIGLMCSSLNTMRDLLGLPASSERKHPDSAMGSMGSSEGAGRNGADIQQQQQGQRDNKNNVLCPLPLSFNTMSTDMQSTLEQLKTVLTNPNFVSIEEVEEREEEIARLREGWDRMELRWKDVLGMMEGWRKRMNTGETINIEDLRRGLVLVSPSSEREGERGPPQFKEFRRGLGRRQDVDSSEISESHPTPRLKGVANDADATLGDMSVDSVDSAGGDVTAGAAGVTTMLSGRDAKTLTPATSAILPSSKASLSRTMANLAPIDNGRSSPKRKFGALDPPETFDLRPSITTRRNRTSGKGHAAASRATVSGLSSNVHYSDDSDGLPEDEYAPQLTVAEKLNATQAEAEEVKATLAARSKTSGASTRDVNEFPEPDAGGHDTLGEMLLPRPLTKKTKIRGRPRKRKSTLSPAELEALIAAEGDMQTSF